MLGEVTENSKADYLKYTLDFLSSAPYLLNQPNDIDLRIKERTMIVSLFQLIQSYKLFFLNETTI